MWKRWNTYVSNWCKMRKNNPQNFDCNSRKQESNFHQSHFSQFWGIFCFVIYSYLDADFESNIILVPIFLWLFVFI